MKSKFMKNAGENLDSIIRTAINSNQQWLDKMRHRVTKPSSKSAKVKGCSRGHGMQWQLPAGA